MTDRASQERSVTGKMTGGVEERVVRSSCDRDDIDKGVVVAGKKVSRVAGSNAQGVFSTCLAL